MKNWLAVALVIGGVSIFAISLYMASLSGVMGKMGLVGGDFSQLVDHNELARQLLLQDQNQDCGILKAAVLVPRYLLSEGEERVRLSGELGGQRIICGVSLVHEGNVERGVYTIVKGLYYLKSYYTQMRSLIQVNPDRCEGIANPGYEGWVEGYLRSTEGRAHELVIEVYKQVEGARARVEELCVD